MIAIPLHAYDQAPRPDLPAAPIRRLLLVEDDPYYAEMISRVFQGTFPDVTIRTCASHDEAHTHLFRARWSDKPFDAVIVDHFLPDGFGLDFWRVCTKLSGLARRVVIVSGLSPSEFYQWSGVRTGEKPQYVSKIGSPGDFSRRLAEAAQRIEAED